VSLQKKVQEARGFINYINSVINPNSKGSKQGNFTVNSSSPASGMNEENFNFKNSDSLKKSKLDVKLTLKDL
jgi:hypothetical protein